MRIARFAIFMLIAAAPCLAQGPQLKNPGFEQDLEGWAANLVPGMASRFAVDAQTAAEGAKSLRVTTKIAGENPWLAQGVAPILPGATYTLSAQAHGDKDQPASVAVKIEFYNVHNVNTSGYYGMLTTAADGSWQPISVTAQADDDTVKAAVMVRLFGVGTAWFDDVNLAETGAAPALVFSPGRAAVGAKAEAELRFTVHLGRPLPEGEKAKLALTLTGPDLDQPSVLAPNIEQPDQQTLAVTVKVPPLVPGVYTLSGDVAGIGAGSASIYATPTGSRPSGLDERGAWVYEGKPFLPIGLAHVMPQDYPAVAAMGFNCVQGIPTLDEATVRSELDAAKQANLRMILPLYPAPGQKPEPSAALALARSLTGNPAILAWELADEPDLTPGLADYVATVYIGLRHSQLPQPALISIARTDAYAFWSRLCDLVEISESALPGDARNFVTILPAGWSPATQPSAASARSSMYDALIGGAKGLVWYSLRDIDWNLSSTPLWSRLKAVNAEATALAAPMLAGQILPGAEVSNSQIEVHAYQVENTAYFVLMNNSDKPQQGWLRAPFAVDAPRLLSSGQPLPVNNRTLGLKLAPHDVQVIVGTLAKGTK